MTSGRFGRLSGVAAAANRGDGNPAIELVCDVGSVDAPSLETVSALARLQAQARALGCPFHVVHASPRLLELIELAGLSEVLPVLSSADDWPETGSGNQAPSASASDIGSPNSGNSASVSRKAVNSAIWPPENSST